MILPLKNSVVLFIAFLIPHYAKIIFTREFCSTLAKVYGDSVLAGMGISSKLMFIGTFIFMGLAAGCQPLVGFNYGAKNYKRVREIFKTGMVMTHPSIW
jgi:Na+-driven multidrug efflux pump